jgi:6-phosphogluconolactonase (cycloisomerase 2 family)
MTRTGHRLTNQIFSLRARRPITMMAWLCAFVGGASVGLSALPAPARSADDSGRLRLIQALENAVDGVEGLFGARSAAVSPDGAHVYVASGLRDSLAVFARDPADGRLAFVEGHRDGVEGVDGLADARQVVVSPDGAHVYVASAGDPGVAVFARDPATGQLAFV